MEAIYVTRLDGFVEDNTLVCELRKALYGLRQSPRAWFGVTEEFLTILGYISTAAESSSIRQGSSEASSTPDLTEKIDEYRVVYSASLADLP